MRIATWNINGLRARFDFLLHWLRTRQPDIVGLQELKLQIRAFLMQSSKQQVTVLSRIPRKPGTEWRF